MLLECVEQPVPISLMPLGRRDGQFQQVGDSAPQRVAEPADPVADVAGEDEVAFLDVGGCAVGLVLVIEQIREPGREFLALFHFADLELAHRVTPVTNRFECGADDFISQLGCQH